MRSDTERNRRRLIKAAAYLVAHRGSSVRMTDVAERAEVSPATAYRHFGSVDEILSQFRFDVGERLRSLSQKSELHGLAKLEAVCEQWVRLVVKHGGDGAHPFGAGVSRATSRFGAVPDRPGRCAPPCDLRGGRGAVDRRSGRAGRSAAPGRTSRWFPAR